MEICVWPKKHRMSVYGCFLLYFRDIFFCTWTTIFKHMWCRISCIFLTILWNRSGTSWVKRENLSNSVCFSKMLKFYISMNYRFQGIYDKLFKQWVGDLCLKMSRLFDCFDTRLVGLLLLHPGHISGTNSRHLFYHGRTNCRSFT